MRVDRDAAPVVGDGDEAVGLDGDFDPVGVARDSLVHGVVDHLCEEVVEAFSSVPPMYMPGRRRTGSSPSRTSISAAE